MMSRRWAVGARACAAMCGAVARAARGGGVGPQHLCQAVAALRGRVHGRHGAPRRAPLPRTRTHARTHTRTPAATAPCCLLPAACCLLLLPAVLRWQIGRTLRGVFQSDAA